MLKQIARIFQSSKPIVVVSGLPRSGTSMAMKMLDAGGITPMTDGLRTADADNPKGYYEFERVKGLDKGDTAWVAEAEGKAVKVISALLKHLPASHNYRILFLRRDIDEILASQRKMLIRRGEEPNKVADAGMAAMFRTHLKQIEGWLAEQENMEVMFVEYAGILRDPLLEVSKINRFLGGHLAIEPMVAVVDPELYRNKIVGR